MTKPLELHVHHFLHMEAGASAPRDDDQEREAIAQALLRILDRVASIDERTALVNVRTERTARMVGLLLARQAQEEKSMHQELQDLEDAVGRVEKDIDQVPALQQQAAALKAQLAEFAGDAQEEIALRDRLNAIDAKLQAATGTTTAGSTATGPATDTSPASTPDTSGVETAPVEVAPTDSTGDTSGSVPVDGGGGTPVV